jgi:hypothetical protein
MRAANTGNISHPSGSIAVNLGEERIDDTTVYKIQERVKFYIDGLNHTYYIPVGENEYYMYEWDLEQNMLKESLNSLVIEVPDIEGVSIEVESIELKKRSFFALDSQINYFLRKNFNIPQINRYLTPVYVFLILFLILYLIFVLMFPKHKRKADSRSMRYKGASKISRSSFLYILPVVLAVVLLLAGSSLYFMGNSFFTAKSFWSSYRQYIISGNLKDTYRGFYDFEDYILWLDKRIAENENLIVLLRGEPVYLMAEMAYNLYPRDLKFINTGGKNKEQIIDEIKDINTLSKDSYIFINVLTREDFFDSENLIFIDSYSDTGGFLFKLGNI